MPKARKRSPRAVAAGLAIATLLVIGADAYPHMDGDVVCCETVVASKPVALPPTAAHPVPPPTLPIGVAQEQGLQVDTILAARAVSAAFPEILTIGGVRPDSLKWHPHGMAIDVMIPNAHTPAGKALGDSVLAYVLQNAKRFDLNHVIWRQTIHRPDGSQRAMSDRGGDTANHYDHVHIATDGGGYPQDGQTYLR